MVFRTIPSVPPSPAAGDEDSDVSCWTWGRVCRDIPSRWQNISSVCPTKLCFIQSFDSWQGKQDQRPSWRIRLLRFDTSHHLLCPVSMGGGGISILQTAIFCKLIRRRLAGRVILSITSNWPVILASLLARTVVRLRDSTDSTEARLWFLKGFPGNATISA